jgi:hypothetical protein
MIRWYLGFQPQVLMRELLYVTWHVLEIGCALKIHVNYSRLNSQQSW